MRSSLPGVLCKRIVSIDHRKAFFLLIYVCCFIIHVDGQSGPPPKQWDKTLGGPVDDFFHAMIATPDGGYLLGGYYFQGGEGGTSEPIAHTYDYYIVKIDKDGNKEWDKTYGGDKYDYLNSIVNTSDSGYLLAGYSLSGISGDKSEDSKGGYDYWIVKIDKNGNKMWDKSYGGNDYDLLYSIVATPDGGFLLGGNSSSGKGADKSEDGRGLGDYWIIKIDNNGNKQWDKTFGGSDLENFKSVINTPGGGYLAGGYSQSGMGGDKSDTSKGFYDYWIVKMDNNGNKVWDKTFGGSNLDELTTMMVTSDNNFLLGGDSYSSASGDKSDSLRGFNDYWIIKIDSSGNKIWDKTFGGRGSDYFSSIAAADDGGYYLGGSSASDVGGDKTVKSNGESDYWIVKTDASGNKQWDIAYGGEKSETLASIITPSDKGYLLGGQSNSGIGGDKSEAGLGGNDFWVVKLGQDAGKKSQTVIFDSISSHTFGDTAFLVSARASSGLPIIYTVVSGSATVVDSFVTITGAGIVTIQASQPGDNIYDPARSVSRTFKIYKADPFITWDPASLVEDTPLGEYQLNATATFKGMPVSGLFAYSPPAGTMLPVGIQTIKADFTCTDTINFNSAVNITKVITVSPSSANASTVTIATTDSIVTYTSPAKIELSATVTNIKDTISRVEFYSGASLIHTEHIYPYLFSWTNVSAGTYTLYAKAIDVKGNVITSDSIIISVVPENKPPVVKIACPVNDTSYARPAPILLIAEANDPDGNISSVEFYNGATLLKTAYFYPYICLWLNAQPGTYVITAKATDDKGLSTTSAPVTIKVTSTPIVWTDIFSIFSYYAKYLEMKLSPNPARNILYVSAKGLKENKQASISIISSTGVVAKTVQLENITNVVQIDISSLVSGMYTVRLVCGNKVLSQSFIKL